VLSRHSVANLTIFGESQKIERSSSCPLSNSSSTTLRYHIRKAPDLQVALLPIGSRHIYSVLLSALLATLNILHIHYVTHLILQLLAYLSPRHLSTLPVHDTRIVSCMHAPKRPRYLPIKKSNHSGTTPYSRLEQRPRSTWRNTHAIRKGETTRNPVRHPPRSSCKKTRGGSGQTGIPINASSQESHTPVLLSSGPVFMVLREYMVASSAPARLPYNHLLRANVAIPPNNSIFVRKSMRKSTMRVFISHRTS
jgi:hypothetical protein